MEISKNFKKPYWLRRVHPDRESLRFARDYKPMPGSTLTDAYVQLTASDFLNELSPAAHPINSRFMSTRPIYKPSGKTDSKTGKNEWVIDGYDELESVSLGWQLFISSNKIAHLTGNGGFDIANETEDSASYADLISWMDSVGLKEAYTEAVFYAEREGDSGLFLYQTKDGDIEWEVYAEEKGHTIFPQEDADGNPVYYIRYRKDGKVMCDIISTKYIETWVQADIEAEADMPFFERLWQRFVKMADVERSEDGFILVKRRSAQLGDDLSAFTYFWVPDVSWGGVEQAIEAHENAASYVANEVKDSAFPLLVVKAEKVTSLPPSSTNGKTIGLKGTSDSLAHSDVKYETPGDASNIATLHFKQLEANIIRATQTAIIEPEILKQGADSSTSIKILFRPEIEWASQRWIYYYKPVKHLIKVFKRLVGKVEGDFDKYDKLRTSIWQNIWIPQNEQEQTKIVLDKVYARVLSRKAAMNELGSQYKGDYSQIQEEWEKELTMKAEIPAKAKAEYGTEAGNVDDGDNNPADVDNNAPGKSIQQ